MREVFSSVASKYDLMNDAMSGGMHRLWKDAAATSSIRNPANSYWTSPAVLDDIARR